MHTILTDSHTEYVVNPQQPCLTLSHFHLWLPAYSDRSHAHATC